MRRNSIATLLLWLATTTAIGACSGRTSPAAPGTLRASAEFTLSGQIWRETSQSETALGGVAVLVSGSGEPRSTVTGDDGQFTIGGLHSGEWTVRASKDGYGQQERLVQIDRDTTLNFSMQPQ